MSWYFFIFPHVLKYCLLFKIKAPPDAFSGQIEGVTYLAREWPRSWSCHAGLGVACSQYRSREQLILNDLILKITTLQYNAYIYIHVCVCV